MDSEVPESKGRKDDSAKVQMRLLPWVALVEVARVMTWAITTKERPYRINNWKFVSSERYEDAMLRHWAAHKEGELYDSESGMLHLSHMACCVLFLLWHHIRKPAHTGHDL